MAGPYAFNSEVRSDHIGTRYSPYVEYVISTYISVQPPLCTSLAVKGGGDQEPYLNPHAVLH